MAGPPSDNNPPQAPLVDVGGGDFVPAFQTSPDVGSPTLPTSSLVSGAAPFIVEDGTGLPDSNSYVDLQFIRDYAAQFGNPQEIVNASDDQLKDWARQATRWLDLARTYAGRKRTRDQALQHPRDWLEDLNGWWIRNNEIYIGLKRACAELVVQQSLGEQLFVNQDDGGAGLKETWLQVGPIRIRDLFSGSKLTSTKRFPLVEELLKPILIGIGGPNVGLRRS